MELDIPLLKESNVFLNDLFDNVTSAIFISDSDARIYNFNDAFSTLFYKKEDQIFRQLCGNVIGCVFHLDENKDCGQTTKCADCVLRQGIIKAFTERVPVYKERLEREFEINGTRILKHFIFTAKNIEYGGRIMILVIVDDVTEMEDARLKIQKSYDDLQSLVRERFETTTLEAAELLQAARGGDDLLHEIHHRVGNNLQIILSLIKLQMDYSEGSASLVQYHDLERRIQAIAYLYSYLISENLVSKIGMKRYITFLTYALHGEFAVPERKLEVKVECEDLFLDIDTALPLGLIVNELVCNSLRHAYIGRDSGTLALSMAKTGAESCALTISDDGIASERTRVRKLFGLRIVETLVEQLGGTLKTTYDEGCSHTILFKA